MAFMINMKCSHNQMLIAKTIQWRLSVIKSKSTRKEKLGAELSVSKEISIAFWENAPSIIFGARKNTPGLQKLKWHVPGHKAAIGKATGTKSKTPNSQFSHLPTTGREAYILVVWNIHFLLRTFFLKCHSHLLRRNYLIYSISFVYCHVTNHSKP